MTARRQAVESGAGVTRDLLAAMVIELGSSDEAWAWARRRSAPIVRSGGRSRSA